MGGYERDPAPWSLDGIPADFNGKLLAEDWPRFEELMENAIVRVPVARPTPRSIKLINGPEAFTPDGEFILGPTEVRGLWMAAGFCAHGLAGAGGIGQLVAEWIVEGAAVARRLAHGLAPLRPRTTARRDVHARAHDRGVRDLLRREVPGPRARRPAGRCGSRRRTRGSRELGAAFGEKSGWERANWFEPNAARGDESLRPRGWAGRLWSPAIGAEHRACRETAALFDETSFAKIEVSGEGAAELPRAPLREPRRARRRARSPTRRC